MVIGAVVSIGTGMGMPLLSIVMGDMSQAFVYIQMYISNHDDPRLPDGYTTHNFEHDVNGRIMMSVYMGIGLFITATIQVMCFLVASENIMHRLRSEFFRSILRQDISWFDKNNTGTLSPKLFDNLERIKEGTGDKVALAVQFTAQFFGGLIIAFTYDWRLTLIMMSLSPLMVITGAFLAKVSFIKFSLITGYIVVFFCS